MFMELEMALCAKCDGADIRNLLLICLLQCQEEQEALSDGETYDSRRNNYEGSETEHHSDIFEIEKSSKHCDLCEIIFHAFKRTNVQDVEVARGLQIMFRASGSKIEVCYNADDKGGLIKLCGLDVYMDEPDGEYHPDNCIIELIFSTVEEFFRIGQIKEDNSPPILRKMEKDPASKKSFEIATRWLKNCVENHSSCRPPTEFQKPPRRLLQVDNKTQNLVLVESFADFQHVEWVSLSYCWGGEPSMKLTDESMNALKDGISLANFDDTIRDAVLVTRALGISYIWIDALCILQDGKEWSEEASKMNEIYGGSTVTLVIASSNSVKDGFLKKRDLNYIPVTYSTDLAEDSRAKLFISPEWDDSEREYNGPWSKRGWTMQEGLLPNRLLHYTASQIVWKCCEEQRFERGVTERVEDRISETLTYSDHIAFGSGFLWQLPAFLKFKRFKNYLPISLDYPLMSDPETFRLWYDLVEDYTHREFTKISDRLAAISGLARIYGSVIRNPTYMAGLWKEDIIRGLLWHVEGTTIVPKRSADNSPTSNEAFPSWSWASVRYEVVKHDLKTDNSLRALSEIENIQTELVDPRDPFGAVESGNITITGPLRRLPRLYNNEWAAEASMSELERHISEIVEKESQGSVARKYSSPPGGHFSFLVMLGDISLLCLLVLEATGEVQNGINKYRRAGILKLSYTDPSSYASPKLITTLEKMETSITAGLGQRRKIRKMRVNLNAVFMEVNRGNWAKETVMIV
jgi:hypothetical protein